MANFPLIVENKLIQVEINNQYVLLEEYKRKKINIYY